MATTDYLQMVIEELQAARAELAQANNVVEQGEAQERVNLFCYKLALGQENA